MDISQDLATSSQILSNLWSPGYWNCLYGSEYGHLTMSSLSQLLQRLNGKPFPCRSHFSFKHVNLTTDVGPILRHRSHQSPLRSCSSPTQDPEALRSTLMTLSNFSPFAGQSCLSLHPPWGRCSWSRTPRCFITK